MPTETRGTMAPVPAEPLEKHEVFGKSYAEVLAAIKHQDDKLGRMLTALAFLTSAAVALFLKFAGATNANALEMFPGSAAQVQDFTAFAFIVFASGAGFSLAFTLAGIGPTKELPPFPGTPRSNVHSLLFYDRIAADHNSDKTGWWDTTVLSMTRAQLTAELARDFHAETGSMSHRVVYKTSRAREAAACLQLAIVALVVLAVLSSRAFTPHTRWLVSAALLMGATLLPFAEALHLRLARFVAVPTAPYLVAAAIPVLTAALLFSAPYTDGYWYALPYALFGGILAPKLAVVGQVHEGLSLGFAIVAGLALFVLSLAL